MHYVCLWCYVPSDFTVQMNNFTAQKMKFSIKNFFSKRDQIRRRLRIWWHLLKKSLMENFIFCAVAAVGPISCVLCLDNLSLTCKGEISVVFLPLANILSIPQYVFADVEELFNLLKSSEWYFSLEDCKTSTRVFQ